VSAFGTEDLAWQEYANCRGVDPDLFFPERGATEADRQALNRDDTDDD
jgi:hypothetical protein